MTHLLLELTALLTFWLWLAAWQRDRSVAGRRLFLAICAGILAWTVGSLLRVQDGVRELDALRVAYLGLLALPPLWLALGLVVRGARIAQHAPWGLAVLLAPGAALYVLMHQEPGVASLFIAPAADGSLAYGPLWWLHLGYGWALALAGSFHFGMSARRLRSPRDRARRMLLGCGSLLPLLGNAVFVFSGFPGIDPTPILLGAGLVALRSELFSGDLLQALPVSQHDLVSQLPTPLILTDLSGRVTEINPAAQNCLGIAKADALDRNIDALLESAAFAPDFERWSLVASGREAGSILLRALPKPSQGGEAAG